MAIMTFIDKSAEQAANRAEPGLYIFQARDSPQYFRVGETGSLKYRSKQHSGSSGLVGFSDPDFCQMYRPWIPRWIAVVPRGQRYARLLCEAILMGELGKRHLMMAGSSFDVSAEARKGIVDVAEGLKGTFEHIFSMQTAPEFKKRQHRADRLSALNSVAGPA